MMKFYQIIIVFCMCLSCQDKGNDQIITPTKTLTNTHLSINYESQPINKVLVGCGYDLRRSLGDNIKYTRSAIIDIDRFKLGIGKDPITNEIKEFENGSIESIEEDCITNQSLYGINIVDFLGKVNNKVSDEGLFIWGQSEPLHIFSELSLDNDKYSISKQDVYFNKQRSVLSSKSIDHLKYFLTEDFLFNIDIESAKDIVKLYGTHVLTDITIGGKISVWISAEEPDFINEELINFSNDFINHYINDNNNSFKVNDNLKFVDLQLIQYGGKIHQFISTTILPDQIIDPQFYKWEYLSLGLTEEYYTLINSNIELMIPIWEFISNEEKKNQVIDYIKGNQNY